MRLTNSASKEPTRQRDVSPKTEASFATRRAMVPPAPAGIPGELLTSTM